MTTAISSAVPTRALQESVDLLKLENGCIKEVENRFHFPKLKKQDVRL